MSYFKISIQRKDQVLSREVNKDSFTIGRSAECDISLNDNHVSRVHLVVTRRWNQIWVEDKNSSNGTIINGTRIVQGTPVNVIGSDKLQLGKSEYILNIDIEQPLAEDEPLMESADVPTQSESDEAVIAETVAMPPPQFAQSPFQAEKLLHDAKRRAAQIVLEGETQAEKRVQAIYQKAREAQAQAEAFYQTRLTEAHKEADAILADFQNQGRELLQSARNMAQELREEVDVYVQGLREKARHDAENFIAETTLEAEKIKSEALRHARETAEAEGRLLMETSREEVNRVLEFTRLQVQEVQGKLEAGQVQLEQVQKNFTETEVQLKTADAELAKSRQAYLDLQQEMSDRHEAEMEKLKKQMQAEEEKFLNRQTNHKELEASKEALENSVRSLAQRQADLAMDINGLESRKDHLFKEYESQKVFLNEKLEKEKSQMAKSEEQRLEEMRVETAKRLQKLEQDLVEDVIRRKEGIVRDLYNVIEKEVVRHMPAAQWKEASQELEFKMMEALEDKVANISQSTAAISPPPDLLKRRKKEKTQWAISGMIAGLTVFFVAQTVVQKVLSDSTPMKTMVQREAQKRQEDLERRRFNPSQSEELKDTYTDAVIYTRNFPEIYGDQNFQQKLYKSVSQYMYKTWRVEEEKSIQVLASSRALVKELQDRRGQIHPDFIKEGIQKMRELELESLERMKNILGTEVRVDSYRRFERNFYKEEMQRRRMASH